MLEVEKTHKQSRYFCWNCGRKSKDVSLYKIKEEGTEKKSYICSECVGATIPILADYVDEAVRRSVEEVIKGTRYEGMAKSMQPGSKARIEAFAIDLEETAREAEEVIMRNGGFEIRDDAIITPVKKKKKKKKKKKASDSNEQQQTVCEDESSNQPIQS